MSEVYKAGEKVITKIHQYDGVVTEVISTREYRVRLTGHDVEFRYWAHELEKWYYRRFVIDGNHHMRMVDCSEKGGGESINKGSWGIRDTRNDSILFYVTSGASRLIAQEMCKAMNEGKLLTDFLKS